MPAAVHATYSPLDIQTLTVHLLASIVAERMTQGHFYSTEQVQQMLPAAAHFVPDALMCLTQTHIVMHCKKGDMEEYWLRLQ